MSPLPRIAPRKKAGKASHPREILPAERELAAQVLAHVRITRELFPRAASRDSVTAGPAGMQILMALLLEPGAPASRVSELTGLQVDSIHSTMRELRSQRYVEPCDSPAGDRRQRPQQISQKGKHRVAGMLSQITTDCRDYLQHAPGPPLPNESATAEPDITD